MGNTMCKTNNITSNAERFFAPHLTGLQKKKQSWRYLKQRDSVCANSASILLMQIWLDNKDAWALDKRSISLKTLNNLEALIYKQLEK